MVSQRERKGGGGIFVGWGGGANNGIYLNGMSSVGDSTTDDKFSVPPTAKNPTL